MRLQEACVRFNKLAGIRFEELFSQNDMNMIIINKGKTGQLLELAWECICPAQIWILMMGN